MKNAGLQNLGIFPDWKDQEGPDNNTNKLHKTQYPQTDSHKHKLLPEAVRLEK